MLFHPPADILMKNYVEIFSFLQINIFPRFSLLFVSSSQFCFLLSLGFPIPHEKCFSTWTENQFRFEIDSAKVVDDVNTPSTKKMPVNHVFTYCHHHDCFPLCYQHFNYFSLFFVFFIVLSAPALWPYVMGAKYELFIWRNMHECWPCCSHSDINFS